MKRMIDSKAIDLIEPNAQNGNLEVLDLIADKDGHNRFIEYDGTPATITGFTSTYCKASLSGTHLMFVLAGSLSNTTVLPGGKVLASFTLDQWVFDKIYPVWLDQFLEGKAVPAYASDWTTQSLGINLKKTASEIQFVLGNALTLTADRSFRIQFDLLID